MRVGLFDLSCRDGLLWFPSGLPGLLLDRVLLRFEQLASLKAIALVWELANLFVCLCVHLSLCVCVSLLACLLACLRAFVCALCCVVLGCPAVLRYIVLWYIPASSIGCWLVGWLDG